MQGEGNEIKKISTLNSTGDEPQNACEVLDRPSLAREGNSMIMHGEGNEIQASTKISTPNSLGITDDVEGLREQRKFAESKPRRLQEDEELYAEKLRSSEILRKGWELARLHALLVRLWM